MKWLSWRYIKKRYLCWKYGICRWHGTLCRRGGGYDPTWICDTCVRENEYKHRDHEGDDHLRRVEIQELLNREWAIPKAAGKEHNNG